MKHARKIHQAWADYFEKYPQQEPVYAETVHGRLRQLKIVKEYDRVIRLLEKKTT